MKESSLEGLLSRRVRRIGGWAIKLPATFVKGIPDRLVLLPRGVAHFVEMKATGEKPRPIQIFVHNRLRALGFQVFVLDSKEAIECYIKETSNPTK